MESGFDAYRELGLSPEAAAEPELVRAAFKALAKKYHPDGYSDPDGKARAEEKMRRLNEAQSLILSGRYQPPLAAALVATEPVPDPRPPKSGAAARTKAKPRQVPMGPMVVAVVLFLASLAAPVMFGRDHLADALELERQGHFQQALGKVDQAVIDDPRDGEAYLLRARLWQKLNQPERARTDLANARGLVPPAEYDKASQALIPSPTPTPSTKASPATWKPKP